MPTHCVRLLEWEDVSTAWSCLLAARPATSYQQMEEWACANWLADRLGSGSSRWLYAEDAEGPLAVLHCNLQPISRTGGRLHRLSNGLANGLIADRCDARKLWRGLMQALGDAGESIAYASLNRLREGTGFHRLAVESGGHADREWRYGGYSTIETEVDGDKWFGAASKNLRGSLRKARNRLDREGTSRISIARTPDEVSQGFDDYVALESTGWKGDAGALVNRPWEHALLREFLLEVARNGGASVWTLWVDDQPAAAMLCAVSGTTQVVLKTSYNEKLSHLSPGNLLMADLVRVSCDDSDIAGIDLVTDYAWHDRWRPTKHPTFHVQRFNLRHPAGLAVAAATLPRRVRGRLASSPYGR